MMNTTMKNTNVESPDSIPSMADTSIGSSQQLSDYDLSPRQLFAKNERTESESPYEPAYLNRSSTMIEDEVNTEVEYEYEFGSEVSTTSSETTAVAAWNRSHMTTNSTAHDNNQKPSVDDIPGQESHQHSFQPRQMPTITMEDPLEESVSCHGPLTTRQLAELLGAFQSRAMGTSRSPTPSPSTTTTTTERDHPPTLPSMTPREELLLRERAALKKIIQDDSVKIINLRSAMEAQRGMNTVKDIEIQDKEFELQIALDRIDALKREKEVMREREDALMQTIQILKIEVDKLSLLGESIKNEKTVAIAIESNIAANQLDEASDVYDEREFYENSIVETVTSEVPTREQEESQESQSSNTPSEPDMNLHDHNKSPWIELSTELVTLTAALEDIKNRLEAVERKQQDTEFTIHQALAQKRNVDTPEIGNTVLVERNGILTKDLFKVTQNREEVEVVLLHDSKKVEKSTSSNQDSFCCWDTCSDVLSDIF